MENSSKAGGNPTNGAQMSPGLPTNTPLPQQPELSCLGQGEAELLCPAEGLSWEQGLLSIPVTSPSAGQS